MILYTRSKFRRTMIFLLVVLDLSYTTSVSAAEGCSDLGSLQGAEVKIEWWNIQPYGYIEEENVENNGIKGIFPKVLEVLANKTGLKIKYGKPFSSYANFKSKASQDKNNSIWFPIMEEKDNTEECFVPIVATNGPAYFIHVKEIVPLTLLGKGLLQGWQVIALTVVLAGISGVIIWLVDRKSNPEDFPAAFFPGIWQGFWWAFVTMTTVGYGDTAPRSIPARLYCVLWMIIGMIAFSVLTANITSSLTRQTFDAEEKLFGTKVGVLNNTMDAKAALMENANVNNYDSMAMLLSNMKSGNVDGILIERYIAGAYYNQYIDQGLELGTMLSYPYQLGMKIPKQIPGRNFSRESGACEHLKNCVSQILEDNHIVTTILTELSKGWHHFKKSDSNSLFEDESFFYILIGLFFGLCFAGALWHYFVFIPKQRNEENKTELGEVNSAGRSEEGKQIILFPGELERLCLECRDKIATIQKENPNRHFNNSVFPMHLPIGTPNLRQLSTNALGQLRSLPGNTVGQITAIGGQRKRGRFT